MRKKMDGRRRQKWFQECWYVHKDDHIKAKSSNQTKVINCNVSPFPRNSLPMSHMPFLLVVFKRTYRKSDSHACASAGPEGPGIVNHLRFLHNKPGCCVYVSRCFVCLLVQHKIEAIFILLYPSHHSDFRKVASMSSMMSYLRMKIPVVHLTSNIMSR